MWLINRLWRERGQGGKAWGGEGQTPTHPGAGSWRALYRRKDAREGHCLQGAPGSHAAYKKYLHAFAALGQVHCAARWAPRDAGALSPEAVTPGPVSASLSICTVYELLCTGRRPGKQVQGGGCQKKLRELRRRWPLLPGKQLYLLPVPRAPAASCDRGLCQPQGGPALSIPGHRPQTCPAQPFSEVLPLAPGKTEPGSRHKWGRVQPSILSLPYAPCSWAPGRSSTHNRPPPLALAMLPGKARAHQTPSPGALGCLGIWAGPAPTLHLGERQLIL